MLIAIGSVDEWRKFSRTSIVLWVALIAVAAGAAFAQEDSDTLPDRGAQSQASSNAESETQFRTLDDELDEGQLSNLRKLEVFTYLWILTLGATVGSFLNVVIYRLPAGRSITGNSMCPGCDQRIHWRDNIPILGWLKLRGRCRNCKIWIPIRYPAVEALSGGWFVLLLATELLPGGDNLPVRVPNVYDGVVWIIWYTKWDLIGIYLFHCTLGSLVVAAALIQWDGHPLPRRLTWFAIGIGVVAPVFWRHLHPVSFREPRMVWWSEQWRWQTEFVDPISGWTHNFGIGLDGLLDSVSGLVAGLLTGWLIVRSLGPSAFPVTIPDGSNAVADTNTGELHARSFCLLFGVVVTFLGWQSVAPLSIGVSLIVVALSAVSSFTEDVRWQRQMANSSIAVAALLLILLWRTFSTLGTLPDHTGWPIIADSSWWPLSSCEPYASLALAVAVGCLISRTHSLFDHTKVHSPGEDADESLSMESLGMESE